VDQLNHYITEMDIRQQKAIAVIRNEETKIHDQEEDIKKLQSKVCDHLNSVQPELKASIAQLKGLNRGDIFNLRALTDPPITVKTVMDII
jgi:tRNA U34 5-carboxymethylaminomethyl modifying enzyme MnmG/GidA